MSAAIVASCPRCRWRAECDDWRDAERAAMFHYDAAHASDWCWLCERDSGGRRMTHAECERAAILADYAELEAEIGALS